MEPKRDFLTVPEVDSLVEEMGYKIIDIDLADLALEFGLVGDEDIRICFDLPDGKSVHLSGDLASKFIGRMGIPKGVVKEYGSSPKLLKRLEEFSRKKRLNEAIRVIFSGGVVIGVEGGKGLQLDLDDAWSTIKTLPGIEGVQWLRRFDDSFEFRVVSGEADHPPKDVNDVSYAGVWTRVNGKIETGSYVMRLACTNGYLSNYNTTSRKMKSYEREELLHHYRGMLMGAWTESKELLKSYVSLSKKKADKAVSMMVRFFEESRLPRRLRADFMEYVPVLPDEPTLYDVVNLTAEFGRDQTKIRDRLKFEWLAGDVTVEMTDDHLKRCSRCYHIL